jgi:hypothetical protein
MVHRGQIWFCKREDPFRGRDVSDQIQNVFVCGVHEDWVYYMPLIDTSVSYYYLRRDTDRGWLKSKKEHFEKRYTFSKHAIHAKAYWKKKATGQPVQILDVKDDGWSKVQVFYDLNKISLWDFWTYFEPCTRVETLLSLAREKSVTKKMEKIKKRIHMTPGRSFDPGT